MKNRRGLVIGVGTVVLLGFLAIGWYLASPLFINEPVDEAFPFELPTEAEVATMSDDEKMALEAEFMTAVPDETQLAPLSKEEMAVVETDIQEAAALVMNDHEMEEAMPEAPSEWVAVATGSFVGADDFHQGSGMATIYQQGAEAVLRFEDFNVTNGPDLHVLLSTSPNPTGPEDMGETIDLGAIKGNIGNQNYDIPADVDLSQYQSVIIYCQPFHVVFATATLSE